MPGTKIKERNITRNFAYPINDKARIEMLDEIVKEYEKESEENIEE